MRSKKKVVAVLPAFNEQRTIAEVVLKAERHVDEVVVVDDGSTDLTPVIAERLGARVVRHERNLGYGAALRTGFRCARELDADVLVTIDSDAQHDPDEIPALVEPVLSGEADVVGSRLMGKGDVGAPSYRVAGVKAITGLAERVSGLGLSDAQCGFRAYSRRVFEAVTPSEMGMGVAWWPIFVFAFFYCGIYESRRWMRFMSVCVCFGRGWFLAYHYISCDDLASNRPPTSNMDAGLPPSPVACGFSPRSPPFRTPS